jgi:hypothetical protein
MLIKIENRKPNQIYNVSKYVHPQATHVLIDIVAILEKPDPKATITFHNRRPMGETKLYLGDIYPGLHDRKFIIELSQDKTFSCTIPDLKYKTISLAVLGCFVAGTFMNGESI